MKFSLTRPTEFLDRVFLFRAVIERPRVLTARIGFDVPQVPHWIFRSTDRSEFYMATLKESNAKLRGLIVRGEWECIVQSNGIAIEENPISLQKMQKYLEDAVKQAVEPYLSIEDKL